MTSPYGSELAAELRDDALERFLRYVRIDTQSARESETYPSTPKQLELSRLLADELRELGLDDVELTEHGYVFATLPAVGAGSDGPTVGLVAHVDTSPDAPGAGVSPQVWRNYDGGELVLPGDPSQVLSPATSSVLADRVGHDIVTSDGTTLLGADDKAGVAEIMAAVAYLRRPPGDPARQGANRVHGRRGGRPRHRPFRHRALRGRLRLPVDGALVGEIENETFSAVELYVTFHGVGVHPGTAKGKLVNPVKLAARFIASLPAETLSPETTEGARASSIRTRSRAAPRASR